MGDEVAVAFHQQERVLCVDVGDEEAGEEQVFRGTECLQRFGEGFGVRVEVAEPELLDLGNRETQAVLLIDLVVGGDDLLGRLREDDRAGTEDEVGKDGALDAGEGREPGEGLVVLLGGGRAVEVEGVGDQARHEQPGDLGGGREVVASEEIGDDGAGGADGLVDEEDGLRGGRGAETVVVDDLGDVDFGGAGHGLGELVVVDEDEARLAGLDQVGLGEDAEEVLLVVDNWIGGAGQRGDLAAGVGDASVGIEGGGLAVDQTVDGRGGADHPRGGGRIERAGEEADALLAGELHDLVVNREVAGDDE